MGEKRSSNNAALKSAMPMTLSQSVARFSYDLYCHLPVQGNLFFSPISIFTALSMVYAGAAGETARQIKRGLHLSQDLNEYQVSLQHLLGNFAEDTNIGACEFTSANGIWSQKGYAYRNEYLEILKQHFHAQFRQVDFSSNPDEICQDINKWGEMHTKGKIRELVTPDLLSPLSRIIIANAVYFQGKWQSTFDESQTTLATFYCTADENNTKETDIYMMSQVSEFVYFENSDVQCLEMPYAGEDFAMLFVLPVKGYGLNKCAEQWSIERIGKYLGDSQKTRVNVILPQFTVRSELFLADILKKMEMNLSFQADTGDLSGIADHGEDLYISEIIHNTYVDVSEQGTEAAAVTAMQMLECAVPEEEEVVPIFRADRPFLYFIRDRRSGLPLFMGRLTAPPENTLSSG